MNNYDKNMMLGINDMVSMALGTKGIRPIVDNLNNKYNTLDAPGFIWASEMNATFEYSQIEVITGIAPLPDLVDKASRGTSLRTEGFKGTSDEIPRFAKHFSIDEATLRQKFAMFKEFDYTLTGSIKDSVKELMFNSVDKLYSGYNGLITHMRDQIVSKGKLEFGTFFPTSNLKNKIYAFGIKNDEANKGETLWWKSDVHTVANEGNNADPIKDLIDLRRSMDLLNPDGKFEMSKVLFEDLQMHSKVLLMVGRQAYPNSSADDDVISNFARTIIVNGGFKRSLEALIGCAIEVRDTRSAYDVPDAKTRQPITKYKYNFETTNVAYIPYGKLGEIQVSAPMLMDKQNEINVAYGYGGRLQFLKTTDELERTQRVDAELTALPVPEVSRQMAVKTVTA